MNLVDRDVAINELAKIVPDAICDELTESYMNGLTDAYMLICNLPTIQSERIKARWEDAHRYGWNGTFWFIKCSNCGYERKDDTHVLDEEYKFCPYCGAEMENGGSAE